MKTKHVVVAMVLLALGYLLVACGPANHLSLPQGDHQFIGIVQSVENNQWKIDDQVFTLSDTTKISGNVKVGDLVKLDVNVSSDGAATVVNIKAAPLGAIPGWDDNGEQETHTPESTEVGDQHETATPEPGETHELTETPHPTEHRELTSTPRPTEHRELTRTPRPTEHREPSRTPRPTERHESTATPRPTERHESTETPQPTEQHESTETPEPTEVHHEPTETPHPTEVHHEPTATPQPTEHHESTATPHPTEQIEPSATPQ